MQTDVLKVLDFPRSKNFSTPRLIDGTGTNHISDGEIRISPDSMGKTLEGEISVKNNEIQLGDVTYQLSRAFVGSKPASELLIDHLVRQVREDSSVDLSKEPAV